jgi:hypothetical protein
MENRGSLAWQPERPAPPLCGHTAHPTTSTPSSSAVPAWFVHRILLLSVDRSFTFPFAWHFAPGFSSLHLHPIWTGLALGPGIIPDCNERQDSDKNHHQTNRPPMSIWAFHIFLLRLGGWAGTVEPSTRGRCFLFTFRVPAALLLTANALDYESSFLGVNQIIPRTNTSQTSDPIPRLFQTFNSHYPNRSPISKLFENIKFRRHFEAPA